MKRISYALLASCALLVVWYVYASDHSYKAISGTYSLRRGTYTYTLKLKPDQTFAADQLGCFNHSHGAGTWRRLGEGLVVLEGDYPVPPGVSRGADGSVSAEANKSYTLRPSLDFAHGGTRLYKKLF